MAYTSVAQAGGTKQPRRISEKDRTIAALREENERLRDDISVYSSRADELSAELSLARQELGAKTQLIRDRTIASFTTQIAQLKQSIVEKTKQITTLRQDCAILQKDSFQVVELQKCYDAQSKELDCIRKELQDSKTLAGEQGRTIASLRKDCSVQVEEAVSPRNYIRSNALLPGEEKYVDMLEGRGDMAIDMGRHEEAITFYSSALCLNPPNAIKILVKRSKARASKGLWKDALMDANGVRVLLLI